MVDPERHDLDREPHDLEPLYAGPARRTAVSPISRTLEIADATPGMISFACGNPATEALPAAAIAEAAAAAVRDDPVRALQYVRPRGILQEELVALLARRDGIAARADEVLPTSGAIQALSLVAHALLEPGDVVLTESPTYPINLGSFRAHGARVIGVPMDGEGMRVDLLELALAR
ncbi:MAG: aminotransferase class I/II-fold pyridoxal phosphate-dependent enzyme, partial [Candidatus Eiseniibacteriota bacterium]